jgi:hypothetical protein
MSNQEDIERSVALTLKMLEEMFPEENGQPNPLSVALRKSLDDMLDPQKFQEMAGRSYAGATVVPVHPFGSRQVVQSERKVSDAEWEEWVEPFHMVVPFPNDAIATKLSESRNSITTEFVTALLGEFNWRTRTVGAYLAAVFKMEDLMPGIGNMLLQSDVCCVGRTYAVALASRGPHFCVPIYLEYLRYYLTQPQYNFDQMHVYAALRSQTKGLSEYDLDLSEVEKLWISFTDRRDFYKSIDIQSNVRQFENELAFLVNIRDA